MTKKIFISVGECMAELQLAKDGLYSLAFGGDTLNTAWYVRALTQLSDVDVEYFTAVGSDSLSKQMVAFLAEHKVGTQFIHEINDRNVGLYLITLAGAERSFTYWRSTSAARLLADDEEYLRTSFSQADVVYFSGITLAILEPLQRQSFLQVLGEIKLRGATVVFDSNARRRLWPTDQAMKDAMIAGYKAATVAMPTFDDDRALFLDANPMDCAKRIEGYGVNEIVVKDGASSCLLFAHGEFSEVAPKPVQGTVDTTGAGDSFNAGYIAARMANVNSVDAVKLAHKVAGRVICGRGALLDMALFADLTSIR